MRNSEHENVMSLNIKICHKALALILYLIFIGNQGFAQQTEIVDFLKIHATLSLDSQQKSIKATAEYSFKILKKTDSIFLDAKNIEILNVDFKKGKLSSTEDKIWLVSDFKAGQEYNLSFSYQAIPKQTLYFFKDQIWTQGQGKYTSHWLPSIDDTNDKIIFNLSIYAPKDKIVVANGSLKNRIDNKAEQLWNFQMKNPMSSYLVALAIGDFQYKELKSDTGIPLILYYKATDSLKQEPTYRYSKEIFDFLEREIGFAYPWENYKQVPVRDFLYAGMENTTATFFSEAFVVDNIGFNDRNFINVNAHELAHQWFGNLVTAKKDEDHWLQEGFATYYALQAEREIFGEDYYYWKMYESAEQLKTLSDEGKGETLLNPKASSLTFYQKGAWALHILQERVGEIVFKTAVQNYLKKHQFKNVSTQDFLIEVKALSNVDISVFEKNWLRQSAFQAEEAYRSLMKSTFIERFFEISALRITELKQKKHLLEKALDLNNDFIGQEVVYQLLDEDISENLELYKKAFKTNGIYIRQTIALSLSNIPIELKEDYETFLQDDSYLTNEIALYNLWTQFPTSRNKYLDQTKDLIGFQDRNIRQLWLALAYITPDYKKENKQGFSNELLDYASEKHSFEIREKAFGFIHELNLWDKNSLKSVLEACVHPAWRFSKSSKLLLKDILENDANRDLIVSLDGLSPEALKQLNKTLSE